jgi:hypothetical protein
MQQFLRELAHDLLWCLPCFLKGLEVSPCSSFKSVATGAAFNSFPENAFVNHVFP